MKLKYSIIISIAVLLFAGCISEDDDIIAPKPRAYYRIEFPKKEYKVYDSVCPFKFEMPVYSYIENDKNIKAEPCWLNMQFAPFNSTLHLSYKPVTGNLDKYLEDTYTLAAKHQVKASGIEERLFKNDSLKVYGLVYQIDGNAASAVQFYITDSAKHFLRGALYFNCVPNIDSLSPVIGFIKQDIFHLIETFEWK